MCGQRGGGVTIDEHAYAGGGRRHTDTWAQRRDTGEQGLREITHQAGGLRPAGARQADHVSRHRVSRGTGSLRGGADLAKLAINRWRLTATQVAA